MNEFPFTTYEGCDEISCHKSPKCDKICRQGEKLSRDISLMECEGEIRIQDEPRHFLNHLCGNILVLRR